MSRSIGIDLGYGRTKMYSGDNCKANFPSLVSSQMPAGSFVMHDQRYHSVTVEGTRYLTGHEAELHALTCEETRRDNFVCDPGWFALLGTALHLAGYDPAHDILTMGLPPGDLGPDRAAKVLRQMAETPMQYDATGVTYTLDQKKILLVPQGLGIYFAHCLAINSIPDKNVAVVDLGHHTLDMVYLSGSEYIEKQRLTQPYGVGRQLDEIILRERSRDGGKRLRYSDLVNRMDDKAALLNPDSPYFVPGAYDVLKTYTRVVLSMVDAYIDSVNGVDLCLVGGGGARFLIPDSGRTNFLIVADPEMANAIGYWGYGNVQSMN